MIEVATILSAFAGLLKFVQWVHDHNKQQDEIMRTALTTIYTAAQETKAYLMVKDSERNRMTEIALSKLWANAAATAANFDSEWSKIASLKDDYWQNPDEWTEKEIERAGIKLDEIIPKVKELLGIPPTGRDD